MSNLCFVIMPFDEIFRDYYDTIYKPAIERSGLNPKRADDSSKAGIIMEDVLNFIHESSIIIADITLMKPNVIYEIGLAHAFEKKTIIVMPKSTQIPFDLSAHRVIKYDIVKPNWNISLANNLQDAIKQTITSSDDSSKYCFTKYNVDKEKRKAQTVEREQIMDAQNSVVPSLSESDAINLINEMRKVGNETNEIYNALIKNNVPEKWIKRKIFSL